MKSYNSIKINGLVYDKTNLNTLFEKIPGQENADWLISIKSSLVDWFSDDPFIKIQTSGSTGEAKLIRLPKQSMINSAQKTINFFELSNSNTAFLCIPVQYIGGKMMLVRALVGGFNLLISKPAANPFLTISTPVDFAAITSYQLYHSFETLKNGNVRKIIVGGSAISSEIDEMTKDLSAEIYETYGMTETSSHIALRKVNGKYRSDYFSLLNGVNIEMDERGCLVINAPFISSEKVVTNDMVEIIDPTHFRILGRFDNVINSGGVKIYPEQIERKLATVIDQPFYITSEPDEILNTRIVLVLEGDDSNEQFLLQKLKHVLSKYEIPKEIRYADKIELTETGKVKRIK